MLQLSSFVERVDGIETALESLVVMHASETCYTSQEVLSFFEPLLHGSKVHIGVDPLVLLQYHVNPLSS